MAPAGLAADVDGFGHHQSARGNVNLIVSSLRTMYIKSYQMHSTSPTQRRIGTNVLVPTPVALSRSIQIRIEVDCQVLQLAGSLHHVVKKEQPQRSGA